MGSKSLAAVGDPKGIGWVTGA